MSAKDKATNKEQKIRIEASSGLSDSEIDNMVTDAEAHAADDKTRREAIEARNQLDGLVYKVEKDSKEWIDKLSEDAKSQLDAAVEAGKQALKTGDTEAIKQALEGLNTAYSAAGASLYQAQAGAQEAAEAAEPAAEGGEAEKAAEEDVVEADYEIVDDTKK